MHSAQLLGRRNFGYVPNGNRTYYAGRSRCLLAEMVSLLDDDALTAEAGARRNASWGGGPGAARRRQRPRALRF